MFFHDQNSRCLRGSIERGLTAAAAFALAVVVSAAAGCTQTVNVRTQSPTTKVILDGEEIGVVDRRGANYEIGAGANPIAYTLIDNGRKFEGEILRTETSWPLVVAGVGLAVCAAPPCAATACLIANPTVLPALALGTIASTGLGGFIAAVSSPSWVSLPCFAAGGAVGLSPLALLSISQKPPDAVVLGPRDRAGFDAQSDAITDDTEKTLDDDLSGVEDVDDVDDVGTEDSPYENDDQNEKPSPYDDDRTNASAQRNEQDAVNEAEVMAW